jgi:hypothetical protein
MVVIDPKIRKLRKEFQDKLNEPVAKDRWGALRKMFLGADDEADC